MALCREMVDFIGLDAVEQFDKTRRVSYHMVRNSCTSLM
jgi:hypothetical protein